MLDDPTITTESSTTTATATHPAGPRTSTVYPATPPHGDFFDVDPTTAWPMIVLVLLLIPPLGWLLLAYRHDMVIPLRIAIAAQSLLLVGAIWVGALIGIRFS